MVIKLSATTFVQVGAGETAGCCMGFCRGRREEGEGSGCGEARRLWLLCGLRKAGGCMGASWRGVVVRGPAGQGCAAEGANGRWVCGKQDRGADVLTPSATIF